MQGGSERNIYSETDRFIYQPHTEFIQAGGRIRPADLERDINVTRDLFVQPSTIEHLADITPDYNQEPLREYYRTHPNSILLVAELPNEGVVGTVTVMKE